MAEMPLVLASSNKGKTAQFIRYAPNSSEATGAEPLFNEDVIKERYSHQTDSAYEYVASISRNKFADQRNYQREIEGELTDYTIITSDSIVVVEDEGKMIAINRDDPEEKKARYLEVINRSGKMSYVGAVTFGRKNGEGLTTVLSYIDIPLGAELKNIPTNPQDLPKLKNPNKPYEIGYLDTSIDDTNKLRFIKKPVTLTNDFDVESAEAQNARPFISGLTPEVISLADKVGKFEHEVEPILQAEIVTHPFNTLSFYSKPDFVDLGSYYDQITAPSSSYFKYHGGNCVLFTLDIASKLEEQNFSIKAIQMLPSAALESGHTGLLVQNREDDLSFFVDPGLSLAQPIVVNGKIPLYPFSFHGNKQMTVVDDSDAQAPAIVLHTKKSKSITTLDMAEDMGHFRQRAATIMNEMHRTRTHAKLDFHNERGESVFTCSINLSTKTISFRAGELKINGMPVEEVLEDQSLLLTISLALEPLHMPLNQFISNLSSIMEMGE